MTDGESSDNVFCTKSSFTESAVSDSDSSLAPTDFQLSESFEYSSQGAAVSVALERCWLCLGSRRSFHCKHCVRTGDFVHSRPLQEPFQPLRPSVELERYADKQKRWQLLKEERACLVERFKGALAEPIHVGQQQTSIELKRQRIRLMKAELSKLNEVMAKGQIQLDDLLVKTAGELVKLQHCENYRRKLCAELSERAARIERHTLQYSELVNELTKLRRQHISDLITESWSGVDDEQQSTVRLLADAQRTAYVKGRWVYTDTGCEQLYRIISPTLPGNGDYSLAMVDIKEPSCHTGETGLPLELTPLQTITAALSLTAQLVSVLSYYLDVILPQRLDYSEFYASELTDHSFNRAVLRLNHNILRLCFTQGGINIVSINPRHTIVNLLMVLCSPDLGKDDVIDDEETVALMRSIESSLLGVCAAADDDVSDRVVCPSDAASDVSDADELSELSAVAGLVTDERAGDWEHVPLSLPDIDMSLTTRVSSPSYFAESQAATVTSIMSSAASAASSAWSFWRGWTHGSDNK